MPEGGEARGGFTIAQVLQMLLAHVWISAAIFTVMVGIAFLVIKQLPKSYVATATLIVNSEDRDPLAGRALPVGLAGTFFPTQVELINNRVVLFPVIDQLKLRTDRRFTEGFKGPANALDEVILKNIRIALTVAQGAGSDLLYISATTRDAVLSAALANAVADEYLRNLRQRTNAPAAENAVRYSGQLAELRDKVSVAQAKVAEFREKYGMADLKENQNVDSEGSTLLDLQAKLLEAQSARRTLEAQQVDAGADSSVVMDTPEALALRQRLSVLEGQMGELRATMGARNPKVLQTQSDIDATRESLQSVVRARSGNMAMQLARARELENKYKNDLAAERGNLLERRNLQDQGNKLLLELRSAQDTYARALNGLDQVQFASEGNYKDVTLVDQAVPPVKATKPNKIKLLAMAMFVSFGLALGGPFAFELLIDRRIRCRDDLERHFGIVTLAQLGPLAPAPG
jgi:uncharacterized protein involved in exopolysaccharide biosynthesis